MTFEFATATRIVFGTGKVTELGGAAASMGRRALMVTGRSPERAAVAEKSLRAHNVQTVFFSFPGEPTTDLVKEGVKLARAERCELVVGFGGGSAIDAAKAIAAMLANSGSLLDYLEIIGGGRALASPSVPWIAIPTTAGSGAEVTRNAVLLSPQHRVKVSLRSPFMLARLAIIDPELTVDLPRAITASTGLDALTQLIEPYVSCRANPLTDGLCIEGIQFAAKSLRRVCEEGKDLDARSDMALASLFGGLALANAGLGAVHGFAAPIGGMFPAAPHGAVCAALLPHVMLANWKAICQRAPASPSVDRFRNLAISLTGYPNASAEDGIRWIEDLCDSLEIPALSTYGITEADIPGLVERAAAASSMKGNPLPLMNEELRTILTAAL